MTLYFDASGLVKLFLEEPGSKDARALFAAGSQVASSSVAYAEARSALAAASRAGRISRSRHERFRAELDRAWGSVHVIEATDRITIPAGRLAEAHGLRALDAIHLASVLALRASALVVSWDVELRRAAVAEGLTVAPA